MRIRRMLLAAIGGTITAAALTGPTMALALPYDNTDPANGCSSSAYTLVSSPVTNKNNPTLAGTVELRWSRTCNTGWARFTPASGVAPRSAVVRTERPADAAVTSRGSGEWVQDWPLYANQLDGSSTCLVASVDVHYEGPYSGNWYDGRTPCAGGAPPAGSVAETTGGVTNTWTNYVNAGGTAGPKIGANATVHVSCRVQGFMVPDGNTWWYRVATAPWSGTYYASADAFYNNGQTSGSMAGTPFVDTNVPLC